MSTPAFVDSEVPVGDLGNANESKLRISTCDPFPVTRRCRQYPARYTWRRHQITEQPQISSRAAQSIGRNNGDTDVSKALAYGFYIQVARSVAHPSDENR